MIKFIIIRVKDGILVLAGVIIIIFFLFNILPVNSARMTLGQRADTASVEQVEREFRLNYPWYSRLLFYINDISPLSIHSETNTKSPLFLDERNYKASKLFSLGEKGLFFKKPYLGRSFQNRRKVGEILAEKIPPTAILALGAIILASMLGIVLGTLAALKQYTFWDNAAIFLSTLGISLPSYFSGIILAIVFGYYLKDFTGLNVRGSLIELSDLGDQYYEWKNLVLPVIALGLRPVAIITQLMRSSMLDVLNQDYIRTAKSKGLSYYNIIFKHALRNALNPVVTSISGWFAALLAGAFFIEIVFDYKGLGYQTVTSLLSFDFPVVMGAVLFIAAVFVIVNIFVDILYGMLDPRISVKI